MHKYKQKDKEYQNSGFKIRIIKEDLARSADLSSMDIILVYKNMILEDSERVTHYEVDKNDFIWFGTRNDYNEEFGEHVIIKIKADGNYESLDIAEKLIVKLTDKIFHIRNILARIYKWIIKVQFWNVDRNKLLDDQSIEECQLIENPIIIIGAPVFKITRGNLNEIQNNVNYFGGTRLRLNPFEMSPLMEIFRLLTDKTNRNRSILSNLLNFIKLENPENANIKRDLELFIFDWTKYYERADKNQLLIEDKTSIFRQDFGGNINDATDEIELGTSDEHFKLMHSLYETVIKIFEKYFPPPLNYLSKSMEPIFEAYSKFRNSGYNNERFADLRLGRRLNFFFKTFHDDGCRLSNEEFNFQVLLILPDIIPIFPKINSLIKEYWTQVHYSGSNHFRSTYVYPNLNRDRPYLIFTPAEITGAQTKDILSDSNSERKVFLASSDYSQFFQDDDKIPSEENISAITISKFQKFKDLKCIGEGGFGKVYVCTNELTNKQTVVKELIVPSNKSLDQVNEVLSEIITFSQIASHRRIMQFTDYFTDDGKFYIEMDFMKNGSLKYFLNKNGALNEIQIKHFSTQILEGLNYLHGKKICHRDIKADNVLLDDDNNAKLTDFGLSKCYYESDDDFIQGIKQSAKGTIKWMAPEIGATHIYGSPADVWSFGITMIEMITGKEPFPRLTVFGIWDKIKKYGIKEIKKIVSQDLFQLLDSCLQYDPKDRGTSQQLLESDFLK